MDVYIYLKTLTRDVEGCEAPTSMMGDNFHDLICVLTTIWPVMLLAGRIQVNIPELPKDSIERVYLNIPSLDVEVIEACRRFAKCFLSHDRPSVIQTEGVETIRSKIIRRKYEKARGLLRRNPLGQHSETGRFHQAYGMEGGWISASVNILVSSSIDIGTLRLAAEMS